MADFGLSRIYSDPKQTATQGTITHMPPELVRKGVMHKSADVWAFGVLLWEMYSGQRAWAGMSYTQVMQAVGYEQRGPEWPDQAPTALKVSCGHHLSEALLTRSFPCAHLGFNQGLQEFGSGMAAAGPKHLHWLLVCSASDLGAGSLIFMNQHLLTLVLFVCHCSLCL